MTKLLVNSQKRGTRRPGFTLIELVVSMSVSVILMGSTVSALLIANQAIPNGRSMLEEKAHAAEVVDRIASEIYYATSITESTANTVTFTVADRGHGAVGPETIRYAWSGTVGDPLTRQYNGGTVVTLYDSVQSFSLDYTRGVGRLAGLPRVLLAAGADETTLGANDTARRALIESWGFSVEVIEDSAPVGDFTAAYPANDVVYISEDCRWQDIGNKIANIDLGVVNEKGSMYDDLGISSGNDWTSGTDVGLVNNSHEITSGFDVFIPIFSVSQTIKLTAGSLAPGAEILAEASSDPALVVIELGGELYGGGTANGRRVKLPWAGSTFDLNNLTNDGRTVMRRSIAWAAAPVVFYAVRVRLQTNSLSTSLIETDTQILNAPGVDGS